MDTSPEFLDRLWTRWLDEVRNEPSVTFWTRSYRNVERRSSRATAFEIWLESNGGRVVQKHKRRYVEVWDENLFMMLVLQYV